MAQFAESTKVIRSVQIRAYLSFCKHFSSNLEPYPCDTDQVCYYICYLARRLSFGSIRNYLSALNNHLKELEYPPIDYDSYAVKKLLMGIRRLKGDMKKQAAPLLPHNLLGLFSCMTNSYAHTAVRAAMLVCFRALLRKSHVTLSAVSLSRRDVVFHDWGMMLRVLKSKTNQFADRVHLIPVVRVKGDALCAVYWTKLHFKQCPAPPDSMAFRLPRLGNSVPMSYAYYMQVIKCMCRASALNETEFSTHSLRRGGATFLRMCGATIEEIKERGDWKSNAVYQYLKLSVSERRVLDMRVALLLST